MCSKVTHQFLKCLSILPCDLSLITIYLFQIDAQFCCKFTTESVSEKSLKID